MPARASASASDSGDDQRSLAMAHELAGAREEPVSDAGVSDGASLASDGDGAFDTAEPELLATRELLGSQELSTQERLGSRELRGKRAAHDVEDIELPLLLEAILHRYGYDFRHYATASLRRRIRGIVEKEGVPSISALQERVLREPACMARFITSLSVPVTSMFRDPSFYRALRSEVVPMLRTYPFVRIWHAGCSTGEEVYSLAILLTEEGLYDRCRIYATDLSDATLQRATKGIYDLSRMRDYTHNYQLFGGKNAFSSYYTADHERVIFSPRLRKNIVFSQHNLVSDGPFNEFNLILCRNVMIYFDKVLRDQVLRLLDSSLCRLGVLGIGRKETLEFSTISARYAELPSRVRLFRKER